MLNLRLRSSAAVAVGLLLVALEPAPTAVIGYFNLPGNCCQWRGYGCGAGYHAPLVLGPVSYHGCCAHQVERLPYAPCPQCCYAGCGYERGGCGCAIGEPSLLGPTFTPAPAPMPSPEPILAPAAFRVPFRY